MSSSPDSVRPGGHATPAASDPPGPAHPSDATRRLAVYGTLAPGRPNEHRLSGLRGSWTPGVVRGTLLEDGWGAALGYPGIVLDADGPRVAVQLFTSDDLPAHWARLDDFEGDGYERVEVVVATDAGPLPAMIYVLAVAPPVRPAPTP